MLDVFGMSSMYMSPTALNCWLIVCKQLKLFELWIDRQANLLLKNITWQTEGRARHIIASNNTFSPNLPSGPVLQLRQQWAEDKNATLAWLKGLDREVWWDRGEDRGLQAPQNHWAIKAGFLRTFLWCWKNGKNVCLLFCFKNEGIWTDKMIRFRIR